MTQTIHIGNRTIGEGNPCFVIAEAGVNHNGDPALALELVRAVKRTGADCIKFQTFSAERVAMSDAPKANYQHRTTPSNESQLQMLKALELPASAYPSLLAACEEEDILFLSTPYNEEDADMLDALGVSAFKIASLSIVEPLFLRHVAKKGKPIILSSGMATMEEVEAAMKEIRDAGNDQIVLLQCTTDYPAQPSDVNLRAMQTMGKRCATLIGYSDHTQTDTACIVSIALGARVIEKHFTLDKTLPGPDHTSSADPQEFTRLVSCIREAESELGTGEKVPCEAEVRNTPGMRRSIVAKNLIPKGTVLTADMLTWKRPGTGILPSQYDKVVGTTAREDIPAGIMLSMDLLDSPAHP